MSKTAYITERPSRGQLEQDLCLSTPPTTLHLDAKSEIGKNELLIQVKTSSVNIDDIHSAEGNFLGGMPGIQSAPPSLESPSILGHDFAGIIVKIGKDVDSEKFKIGQRVCGFNKQVFGFNDRGTWADYTITVPKNVILLPDHFSFSEGAASIVPLFVIDAILAPAKLEGSERVVVIGSSGGIGSMLVQVLRTKYPQLYIVGVCSSRNEEFVRGMGADAIADYTKGPFEETLMADSNEKFHAVFDLVGGDASHKSSQAILGKRGRFITAVGPIQWIGDKTLSGMEITGFLFKFLRNAIANCIPGSHSYYHMVAPMELQPELFELAFESEIRPHIEKTFPLRKDGVIEAITLVRSHRAKGKIMLQI